MLLATLLWAGGGCAVIDSDQRRLTRWTSARAIPEQRVEAVLTAPLWGTACVLTLAADGLVLNPVFNAPAALGDANRAFFGLGLIPVVEVPLFPLRVVAWPVLFTGSELLRCSIPWYPL